MAITTAMCSSFKQELLEAGHDFTTSTGDSFKLALIKPAMAGTYGAASTNYSDITGNSDEASGTGYTAGGSALTISASMPGLSGTTAFADFADVTFSSSTISADGCMIYNTSLANAAVSVHSFGSTKSSSSGDFVVQFPTADATNAILRLA